MNTQEYLGYIHWRLVECAGWLPVDLDLPGPRRIQVHDLLLRRADPGEGGDLFVALIPADGLTPEDQAAVVTELAGLTCWHDGKPAAMEMPPVVAVFVFSEDIHTDVAEPWAALQQHRGHRVLPWVVDLVNRRVIRHEGPPTIGGLDVLADFTRPAPPAAGAGDAADQRPSVPYATYGLLAMIAAAYLWVQAGGSAENTRNLIRHGANDPPSILWGGEYWRLLTSLFLHGGTLHLFSNSVVLLQTGRLVEMLFGRWRFLFIYLVAGLSGSWLSLFFGDFFQPSVGASGAIFGLFGAMVFFRATAAQGVRLSWGGLLWPIAINLSIGLIIPHVDNWAHIGGLVGGLFAAVVTGLPRPLRVWRGAAVGAITMVAVLLLAGWLPMGDRGMSLQIGQQALAAGRLEQAEALFSVAQELHPGDWQPHYFLAQVLEQQGRRTEALAQARAAWELNPGQADVRALIIRLEAGP